MLHKRDIFVPFYIKQTYFVPGVYRIRFLRYIIELTWIFEILRIHCWLSKKESHSEINQHKICYKICLDKNLRKVSMYKNSKLHRKCYTHKNDANVIF
jgi:hypothetical protein